MKMKWLCLCSAASGIENKSPQEFHLLQLFVWPSGLPITQFRHRRPRVLLSSRSSDPAMAAAGCFRLGQRVHAAGDPRRVGTVRYLGPVEGHAGDWAGVDWDAGAGGRHDGSVAGRRYFVAAGECSASFARPTALTKGITLPDALRLRYRVEDFTKEEEGELRLDPSSAFAFFYAAMLSFSEDQRLHFSLSMHSAM